MISSSKKPTKIEWMCTHCGKKTPRPIIAGRPVPGTCPRRLDRLSSSCATCYTGGN